MSAGALQALALAGTAALAGGTLAAALRRGLRPALALQAVGIALLGVAGGALVAADETIGAPFRSTLAPALGLDGLSGFFLALLAVTGVPALAFAAAYLPATRAPRALAALTGAFLLALAGVLAARDVATLLACWELMTIVPAAAIVVARPDAAVRRAVFTYVAITHLASAGVWIALLTLADAGAIGDPAALAARGGATQTLVAIAALVGFGAKAGLVPLHSWLPRAHPVAPAHLSALMSGLMIKVALYGLVRVLFEWLGATPRWLGIALLALGALSALGGVLWALVQRDLKRLLAYSSIENAGIVLLGLGASLLLAAGGEDAWASIAFAAALLHAANHAVFKVLLFLGAGALERATGTLELDRLGGLARRMPQTAGALAVGLGAIAGLPLLNGFASEWLTLQSLFHATLARPLGASLAAAAALAALAATAALALLCFVKVGGLVLLGRPRSAGAASAVEAPRAMRGALAALAALCVALALAPGLLAPALAELAPGGAPATLADGLALAPPGTGTLPAPWLVLALVVLIGVLARLRGTRCAPARPAWACGQPQHAALAWTSAGFTKPLGLVLEGILRPRRELDVERTDAGAVTQIAYARTIPALAEPLIEPVVRGGLRAAAVARRLQSGSVRTYAAYLLALVLGLLALAGSGALG